MPFPVAYTIERKGSTYFTSPRSPPSPPKPPHTILPVFQKVDEDGQSQNERRSWMGDSVRNHLVAMIAEFIGTTMFLFLSFTAAQIANSKPQVLPAGSNGTEGPSLEQLLYISIGFGVSLALNAWIFFRVSGGAFNPAVTLGLCIVGAVPWTRGSLLFPVQIAAGIVASFLASAVLPGDLLVANSLGSGTTVIQGFFIEMLVTAELIFTILMLAVEKHRATFVAPVGIGMALFLGNLVSINFSGAGINPARSFGPAVALRTFPTYHWIYWVGPSFGAIFAAMLYKIFKFLEYETSNAGQDDDGRGVFQVVHKNLDHIQLSDHNQSPSLESYYGTGKKF